MSVIDELVNQFATLSTERDINDSAINSNNMALPQIHVRDYLELIPTFDGNPTKLSAFINACEKVIPLMAPGNESSRIAFTMLHIQTKLVGKAAALISARNYVTFPELKHILIGLFGDQRNEESLLSDLNILKQKPSETPHQFADRCIDIRCLLLSKLDCQAVNHLIKESKVEMYNAFTLRAFITGVNPQLSHLLRCRNPKTIEEAIQIVIEEENLNYHRSKIGASSVNLNKPTPGPSKPSFQLRINPPQTRQFFSQPPPVHQFPQFNKSVPPQPQKWTPKPFPAKHPFFQQQQQQQQPRFNRPQQAGSSQHKIYKPTPMEVDSDRTLLSNRSYKRPQPKYTVEELTTQEIETPDQDYEEYQYEEQEYYENYEAYENYPDHSENQNEDAENFQVKASETQNMNQ